MKRSFFIPLLALTLPAMIACNSQKQQGSTSSVDTRPTNEAHNSQNSLDWPGVYKGILPCADCEGIETRITLKSDHTYQKTLNYLGKEERETFTETGSFTWNVDGAVITLSPADVSSQQYQVGEGALFHLDRNGKRIEGDLSSHYILKKNRTDARLEGKKWVLSELMGVELDSSRAFLWFDPETSSLAGNGSCNNIFGPYELREGDRITFGKIASTMMACPEMATERSFMEVLNTVDNYSVHETSLTLNKARMAPLAVFELQN